MSQTERIHRIHQMLQQQKVISRPIFLQELEVSRSQFKRDLAFLRDRLQVQIEWDSEQRGYRLCPAAPGSDPQELPGPMYQRSEIHALLVIHEFLAQIQPGLLDPHLEPLRERLSRFLGTAAAPSQKIRERVRILSTASRPVGGRQFRAISEATLARRRLRITHYRRPARREIEREISPQRLVYYRANWYVDSWCHLRQDVRRFAIDAIQRAVILRGAAQEISAEILDQQLGNGYGIFSGGVQKRAVLRFEPEIAQWVSNERWHPDQEQQIDFAGSLTLTVPYAEEQELVMDILRYGSRVDVIQPTSLRERVKAELSCALQKY